MSGNAAKSSPLEVAPIGSSIKRVACFIPDLTDGGAQRAVVKLTSGFCARGIAVDLVLSKRVGPHLAALDAGVRVIDLSARRVATSILPLANYLRSERPHALISFLSHANVAAVIARRLSRVATRLVLVEQNTVSAVKSDLRRDKWLPILVRQMYPLADIVVAVSAGVAQDLVSHAGIAPDKVLVIPNPVVDDSLLEAARAPSVFHPWFEDDRVPVVLAVGRLTPQKDFSTLLHAFAMLRANRVARLLIVGEGEERARLEALTSALGLVDDVALPGFVDNPYSFMSRASVLVLSSRWEGLPTVLIEALACGCPVISTDCPSGPREILEGGRHGTLVPVNDAAALCDAMAQALETMPDRQALNSHAMKYSVERSVDQYVSVLGCAPRER